MAAHDETWLSQALARTDGTVGGVAMILTQQPEEDHPPALRDMEPGARLEAYARMIHDVFLTANAMEETFQKEFRASGASVSQRAEDAWTEVAGMAEWLRWSGDVDGAEKEEAAAGGAGEPAADSPADPAAPGRRAAWEEGGFAARAAGDGQETSPRRAESAGAQEMAAGPRRRGHSQPGEEEEDLPPRPPSGELGAKEDEFFEVKDADIEPQDVWSRLDMEERFALVGDANDWSMSAALVGFRLARCSGRVKKTDVQESKVQIEVPPCGATFQLCNTKSENPLVLCPGMPGVRSNRARAGLLHEGSRDYPVLIAVGAQRISRASRRVFKIPGRRKPFMADVRVAVHQRLRPEVWYTEAL